MVPPIPTMIIVHPKVQLSINPPRGISRNNDFSSLCMEVIRPKIVTNF